MRIKDTSYRVDVGVGGVVSLRKSILITVEIGGATAQIELRRVTDKRRVYSVSGLLQRPKLHHLVQRNSKFPRRVSSTPTVAQETKHFGEI